MYRHISVLAIGLLALITIPTYGGKNDTKAALGKVSTVETVRKVQSGMAVDFQWKDQGKLVSFSEFTKGKVVVLNFWGTWCGPCRREIPDLIEVQKEMAAKGVVVIGIPLEQVDNKVAVVKDFVEKSGINYLNVVDNPDFELSSAYGGIASVPTTYIIDRNGKIAEKIIGMMTKAKFIGAVNRAL